MAEPSRRPRVLVLAHSGALVEAMDAARALHAQANVDMLPLGRGARASSAPAGARLVSMPTGPEAGPKRLAAAALRFIATLRRQRYDGAIVALGDLRVNHSRGAILGLTLAAGAIPVICIDPASGDVTRPLRRRILAADGLRFVGFHSAAVAFSAAVGGLLDAVARKRAARAGFTTPGKGWVAYVRSDIELSWLPLRAGGSLSHSLGILAALRRRGNDVELFTTGEMAGAEALARERRLPVIVAGNVPRELCEFLSGLRQGLMRLPDATPPSFVYQRHSMNSLAGVLLARRWGVPLVLEANASEVQWRQEWGTLRLPRLAWACERLTLREADRIVAVSANAATHLTAAGAVSDRLRVVPNGVEADRFAEAEAAALPFSDGSFVIGFVGLFYPWHGVRYLAEAFVSVAGERSRARLLLVGDGEDRPLVERVLASAGVTDRVHFTGVVAAGDVPRLLAACDVLASPHAAESNFIGSPIKLWEYMAAGRAIVASSVAQLRDVVRDGETGLLVPPRDPRALAAALVRLHDDAPLRERLGAAAQLEATREHSWDARLRASLESDGDGAWT